MATLLLSKDHPWVNAVRELFPEGVDPTARPSGEIGMFWSPVAGGSLWFKEPGRRPMLLAFDVDERMAGALAARLTLK